MGKVTNDIDGTIGDKVLFAFELDYNERYPEHKISHEFRVLIHHYICMAANISATNIIETILEDFKAIPYCQISPRYVVDYLLVKDFSTNKIIDKDDTIEQSKP